MSYISNLQEHINVIHPELAEILTELDEGNISTIDYELVEKWGGLRIIESRRTVETQLEYMKKGVSWVENPLASAHPWGLAVDIVYRKLGYGGEDGIAVVAGEELNMNDFEVWNRTELFSSLESAYPDLMWGKKFGDFAHIELQKQVPSLPVLCEYDWWEEKVREKFLSHPELKQMNNIYYHKYNDYDFDYEEYEEGRRNFDKYLNVDTSSFLKRVLNLFRIYFLDFPKLMLFLTGGLLIWLLLKKN